MDMMRKMVFTFADLAGACVFLLAMGVATSGAHAKAVVVAKWGRYEHAFKSSAVYSNALQDVSLRVVFTSPLGETNVVDGFWDGGRIWRVRFSPNQPGRWKYRTICPDAANEGLFNQHGEFLCSAPMGLTRFERHGQVRLASDHRYFEHMDGTPFFWLADTAWNGARRAELKDWEFYAGVRAAQRFTVVQWAVAPGDDTKNESAYSGFPDRINVNPEFFRRLDARLEVLNQAGMLGAVVPLLEMQSEKNVANPLPDDQAELLVRYMVARWGAQPVAWLIAFEGDSAGKNVGRWKRIGRAVFGSQAHAPVILFPGGTQWLVDEFRDQAWVDAFGYQSVTGVTDDALKWTFTGPFPAEWKKEPTRPVIPFTPCENSLVAPGGSRFSSDDVRHAVYWSLLLAPPAGVSYGGQGVADWDTGFGPGGGQPGVADLPMWRKALFMPAAKQMTDLAKLVGSIDFWRLRPEQKAVASQSGEQAPRRFIVAARSDAGDLTVVYVPEDRTVDLSLEGLPPSPSVNWFNPRTGETRPAVAVVGARSCQFPTPEKGDWVLLTKAKK